MMYPPIVLLVDDDKAARYQLRKRFLNQTNLGVIVASNLAEACSLVDNSNLNFDSVVADYYFVGEGMHDLSNELYDGVDLLEYVKKKKGEEMPLYMISCYAEEDELQERIRETDVEIDGVFQKLNTGLQERSPMAQIERRLMARFAENLEQSEPDFSQIEKSTQDMIADGIRAMAPKIRFTYLQIDTDAWKSIPIEVMCKQELDQWRADAYDIGLLEKGEGDSVSEALDDLAEKLINEREFYESTEDRIDGYALKVKNELYRVIEKKI